MGVLKSLRTRLGTSKARRQERKSSDEPNTLPNTLTEPKRTATPLLSGDKPAGCRKLSLESLLKQKIQLAARLPKKASGCGARIPSPGLAQT
jgi:hypothetical protein